MRRFHTAVAIAAALLLGTALAADAQTIGFKLGASLANISEEGTSIGRLTGFAGGGFVRLGGRLGIQAELLTVTKGAEEDEDVLAPGKLQLEDVEIPVLLHAALTTGSSFAPYVFAGPSAAFEVRCESNEAAGNHVLQCGEPRKSTDFGVHVGGGLGIALGPGSLLAEGRYNMGFTNLDDSGHGHELKTRTIMIMVGYAISLVR